MELSKIDLPANANLAVIREMDSNQVSALVKKNPDGTPDKTECYKFIKVAIIYIGQFFGAAFTDGQLHEMAKLLYAKFWYWRMLDWKNFREKACGLQYGKLYGQLNPAQLMELANHYDSDWTLAAESDSFNEHDMSKKRNENMIFEDDKEVEEKEKDFHKYQLQYLNKMKKFFNPEIK